MSSLPPKTLYDKTGQPIHLLGEIGRGGEATVYNMQGRPDEVVKVYTKAPVALKIQKIEVMDTRCNPKLSKIAAWPSSPAYDKPQGTLKGFLMPKVQSEFKEIHLLYGTSSRKQTFPNADWHFIVHTARNLASAVNTIHESGIIIGDLNEKNILISNVSTGVMFLDCDSFQITANGNTFPCEVGVSHYTPPELQGKSFNGVTRTLNHDYFGLAILLFRLLFLARHPFAGRYSGPGEQPTIEKAIANSWFCYGHNAHSYQMAPPPGTLTLKVLPPQLSDLFERAFSPDGHRLGNRPSPKEWMNVLDYLEGNLKQCGQNSSHKYYNGASTCPWCTLETSGVVLFRYSGTINTPSGQVEVDITILWQRISAIPSPGPAPTIVIPSAASLSPTPLPGEVQASIQQHKAKQFFQITITLFLGCWLLYVLTSSGHWIIGLLVGWILWGITESIRKTTTNFGAIYKTRQKELQTAQERFNFSKAKWDKEVSDKPFLSKLEALSKAYLQTKNLNQEFLKEKQHLENNRRNYQLKKFLEQEYIEHANLSGIGSGLKATLESYGYETAADLMNFQAGLVPGFGEKRVAQLIAWRKSIEAGFTFNPHQAIDPQDIQALKNKYDHLKSILITTLNNGEYELQNLKQEILKKRSSWRSQLDTIAKEVAQKQADLRVF